ncbi:Bug family tripartite tricarboxylate transporter substrate binding protein [Piscinibacter koreensis]|uniref:Tripartite tricarboxylate transporter substrate binding protein n=1 Tax=Piscinibacter koreensis TaxID=2742824 RepID=A0A7Y6NPH2_9BURK|nr:tripartite tricarboxylate transporter substrate binding protein [Schlegelella koreensis]NUZ06909.1 tripartite tricarboxylate transporter substrate binding protein [Schlegelella koreensis]
MTFLQRRRVLRGFAAAALASALPFATAQDYPSHSMRIIVPFAPGGSTDVLARLMGNALSERLGQPVVVDNRAGAGGNIGAAAVAKAAPDGYTLVMGSIGTHATNGLIYPQMPYDALKDFAPVALIGTVTLVLVVHPSIEARSAAELVALLKKKPGEISYASGGVGASQHLAGELFKFMTKTSMQHVPYKGSAGALSDLLAGRVPVMFADLPLVAAHIASGGLKALAVADPERSPALPNVPTVAESGVPGYFANAWYGLFAPAGTPQPVLAKLQGEITAILKQPAIRKTMIEQGASPSGLVGADLRRFQENEVKRWGEVVRTAGIKME